MLELRWTELSEHDGGGFVAHTPIGDYNVWEMELSGIYAELWDGPAKQGQIISETDENIDMAKDACQEHYNLIYRSMMAMGKMPEEK